MQEKKSGRRIGSRNYTREFRAKIVALTEIPGRTIAQVAQEHGLNPGMVSRWRLSLRRQAMPAHVPAAKAGVPDQLASSSDAASAVVVEHGATRIRFEGSLDLTALQTVLTALRKVK
jgi:transposase